MAYSVSWDETAPVGNATAASDIDLVIRNLKRDLRERIDPLYRVGNLSTTSTSETSLATYTLPANTLDTDGMVLSFCGVMRAVTQAGSFVLKFGATSFPAFSVVAGDIQPFLCYIVRTGASTQQGALFDVGFGGGAAPTENTAANITVDLRALVGAGGTFRVDGFEIQRFGVRP